MSPDRLTGRAPKSYAYRVGDRLGEDEIAARIRNALAGQPASAAPSNAAALGSAPPNVVLWEDAGDEVLVHLDSLRVLLPERMVVVSVDLESDQTQRAPVILRFVFGSTEDAFGMVASTDELPHGNPVLAARWGTIVREVVWAALIGTVEEHARERGLAPQAIHFLKGHVRLRTSPDVPLADRITPVRKVPAASPTGDGATPGTQPSSPGEPRASR